MKIKEALRYIDSLEVFGMKLGLDNITSLLKKSGDPQNNLKCIHVAGTNGKGSVCAMLSTILRKAGYKVGLYTSPHLVRFNERIKVNDKEISNIDLARLVEKLKPLRGSSTYFEFTTAMALIYFKEQKVDYAIMETGLGGRLDATNVINAGITVITSISIEHTQQLGETIENIAFEKSCIIKEKSVVFTSNYGIALDVIKATARQKRAKLIQAKPSDYECSLKGWFQKQNIGIAVEVAKFLGIEEEIIKKGLSDVKWPGRFEFIRHNLLLDCCHNPGAAGVLSEELMKLEYRKLILVIGMLKNKDYKSVLNKLTPLAAKVFICKPKTDRALDPKLIFDIVIKDKEVIEDCVSAVDEAKKLARKDDLILVTGSIYVVGEVYGIWSHSIKNRFNPLS